MALAAAPSSPVTVQVAREAGDADLSLVSGASFTFSAANWQTPRTVLIGAAADADAASETATFTVSGPGLSTERVLAKTIDDSGDAVDLVVSTSSLSVPEGESATFTVALAARPNRNTAVTLTRVSGDTDLQLTSPAQLTFTASNWSTPQTVTVAAAVDEDGIAGRARIVVAAPLRASVVELVEIDSTPQPEPDAGLDDAGADDAGVNDASVEDSDGGDAEDAALPGATDAGEDSDLNDAEVPAADASADANAPAKPPHDASTGGNDGAEDMGGKLSGGCAVHGRPESFGALWLVLGAWLASRRRKRGAPR